MSFLLLQQLCIFVLANSCPQSDAVHGHSFNQVHIHSRGGIGCRKLSLRSDGDVYILKTCSQVKYIQHYPLVDYISLSSNYFIVHVSERGSYLNIIAKSQQFLLRVTIDHFKTTMIMMM